MKSNSQIDIFTIQKYLNDDNTYYEGHILSLNIDGDRFNIFTIDNDTY